MKIVLLTEFFDHPDPHRTLELMECLWMNIQNPEICELVLLVEDRFEVSSHITASGKVKVARVMGRATFADFFELINSAYDPDTIYMIANLDIYFDASVVKLRQIDWPNTIVCLSRWNLRGYCGTRNGEPLREDTIQWNSADSHDCWITAGPVDASLVSNARFSMGIPGCDGKLCYLFQQMGYRTINPCEDIHAYHKHLTGGYPGHRTYTENQRLSRPYGRVPKTKLDL
jgi:hypothetical protein